MAVAWRTSSRSPTTSSPAVERSAGPGQRGRRVGLAGLGAVEAGAERHGTAAPPASPRRRVESRRRRATRCASSEAPAGGQVSRGPPLVRTRHPVADRRAVEDAGVAALQPVVEPGQRLDVQALPGPGESVVAQQRIRTSGCWSARRRSATCTAGAGARSASRSRDRPACRSAISSGRRSRSSHQASRSGCSTAIARQRSSQGWGS